MELMLAARRQVTESQAGRYAKATRAEKQAILDHLCAVNGWHRDHARKALRRAALARRRLAGRGSRPFATGRR